MTAGWLKSSLNIPPQAKLASIWLVDGDFIFLFFFIIERMNDFSLSLCLKHLSNRKLISTSYLNLNRVALSSVIVFLHCKTQQKVPFAFSPWPHLKSKTIHEVRAGSCPGCRGPSRRSWCLSLNHHRCARPPLRFSLVSACGWHSGEPTGPGSQNGRAFHQMGPGSDRRGGGYGVRYIWPHLRNSRVQSQRTASKTLLKRNVDLLIIKCDKIL